MIGRNLKRKVKTMSDRASGIIKEIVNKLKDNSREPMTDADLARLLAYGKCTSLYHS